MGRRCRQWAGTRAEPHLSVRSFQLPGRDGAHVQVPVLLLLADGVVALAAGRACLVLAGPVLGPPLAFRSAQVGECRVLRKRTGSSPARSLGLRSSLPRSPSPRKGRLTLAGGPEHTQCEDREMERNKS